MTSLELSIYFLFFQFEDEIDRSVSEVNRILGKAAATPSSSTTAHKSGTKPSTASRNILTVEHKNLNPDNEMRKIFGSRVVAAETRSQNRRGGPGGARNRAPIRSSHVIVVPKPTWPSPGKTGEISWNSSYRQSIFPAAVHIKEAK